MDLSPLSWKLMFAPPPPPPPSSLFHLPEGKPTSSNQLMTGIPNRQPTTSPSFPLLFSFLNFFLGEMTDRPWSFFFCREITFSGSGLIHEEKCLPWRRKKLLNYFFASKKGPMYVKKEIPRFRWRTSKFRSRPPNKPPPSLLLLHIFSLPRCPKGTFRSILFPAERTGKRKKDSAPHRQFSSVHRKAGILDVSVLLEMRYFKGRLHD